MIVARLVVEMDDDLHGKLKAVASLRGKKLRQMVIDWAMSETKDLPTLSKQTTDRPTESRTDREG